MQGASEEHIRATKAALNRLGWYTPDPAQGMHGDIDENFKDSVYAYQRMNTVFFGDTALGPGSTTERLLNRDLAALDESATYVWRTVGDEKVRGKHAGRNGQKFSWNNPPDGENPAEDYNCRCWAEPLTPPSHPWIAWVHERRTQRSAQAATREKLAPPRGLNAGLDAQKFPTDGIQSVYPVETVLGIGLGGVSAKLLFNITERSLRDPQWSFGEHKSGIQWANRMEKRNWTAEKISETIAKGKKFKAPNDLNKGNKAIRYEYKGNFVVRDKKTKRIIQLGAEHFDRRIK